MMIYPLPSSIVSPADYVTPKEVIVKRVKKIWGANEIKQKILGAK